MCFCPIARGLLGERRAIPLTSFLISKHESTTVPVSLAMLLATCAFADRLACSMYAPLEA